MIKETTYTVNDDDESDRTPVLLNLRQVEFVVRTTSVDYGAVTEHVVISARPDAPITCRSWTETLIRALQQFGDSPETLANLLTHIDDGG